MDIENSENHLFQTNHTRVNEDENEKKELQMDNPGSTCVSAVTYPISFFILEC